MKFTYNNFPFRKLLPNCKFNLMKITANFKIKALGKKYTRLD